MTGTKPAHNHERGAYPWVLCAPGCPAWTTAMCACSHHWSHHAESGQTAPGRPCWGIKGSATPGPYEPCDCRGFAPWTGPTDSRTGEPVRPVTLTTAPPSVAVTPDLDRARSFLLEPDGRTEIRCPGCFADITISERTVFPGGSPNIGAELDHEATLGDLIDAAAAHKCDEGDEDDG